jgi:signal transduction histidine kinase
MDISIVIKKTLVYSTVTAILTAVYVLITIGFVRGLSRWVSFPSAFSSGVAACAMALLFHPLRMKVQRFVDRHFMRESLDQAILREATSGFVHEIKRPLSKIGLPTELSLADLQDLSDGKRSVHEVLPKVMQRLRYILSQTIDAGDKIEAIQEISASDRKPSEDVDLVLVVKHVLEIERELLNRNHVRVHLDLPDTIPHLRGQAKQLEIVISNLIKNAVEALSTLPPGADREIWIILSSGRGQIVLTVKDSGPGIKPENLKHLFEPYFTTKGPHGTGMGLFLCRQIVQAHGGKIDVRSQPGTGAKFIIQFVAKSDR